ncbi:MAG: hypothetical protein PGN22_02160 [Agrobacterium cavarae]
MRVGIIVSALATGLAFDVYAQADSRAVDACKAGGKAFTEIAACLPEADVAFRTLDAFSAIYPKEAEPLKNKCLELNTGNIVGASTCVKEAIKASLALKDSLPAGQSIDDPIFLSVAVLDLSNKLEIEVKKARGRYPDKMLWGGSMYHAYK